MNEEDQKLASANERPPRPIWRDLFKTAEGRVLLLGIAIALAGLIVMGLVAFWSLPASRMIGAMIFTNLIFGWAVSLSIGYAGGYGHALVIAVNIWVETTLVLLFYPVFVFSIRKLVEFPRLKRFLERTQVAAERHHTKVRRYGIAGLFVFVWLPVWKTGPVLASAIGYLIGFPAWLTLLTVLTGTYTAMAAWTYLLHYVYSHAASSGLLVPLLTIGIIILMILVGYWLNRRGKNHVPKGLE